MSNKFLRDNCIFEENPKNAFLLTSFLTFFSKPMLFLTGSRNARFALKNCPRAKNYPSPINLSFNTNFKTSSGCPPYYSRSLVKLYELCVEIKLYYGKSRNEQQISHRQLYFWRKSEKCIFLTSFLTFFSKPMLFLKLGVEMQDSPWKTVPGISSAIKVHVRFPSYEPKTTPLP